MKKFIKLLFGPKPKEEPNHSLYKAANDAITEIPLVFKLGHKDLRIVQAVGQSGTIYQLRYTFNDVNRDGYEFGYLEGLGGIFVPLTPISRDTPLPDAVESFKHLVTRMEKKM